MRKLLVFIICLALVVPALVFAEGNLRHSIMVSKFENHSNWSGQWKLGDTFGAMLTDSLQQTKKFIVLGEKDMRNEAMAEQDFGESGRTAGGKKRASIGHITPAQLLVKGEITHFEHSTSGGSGGIKVKGLKLGGGKEQAEINAVIYVVDSTTAQVISSKKVIGKVSKKSLQVGFSDRDWGADLGGFKKTNVGKAVEAAVDEAVKFLSEQVEEIPWEGSIILVKNGKVYINRGKREGVSKGQSFVVGAVEQLRDPDTGELLDVSLETAGKVVVDTVKDKVSIASITEGEGKIEKGMTVMVP